MKRKITTCLSTVSSFMMLLGILTNPKIVLADEESVIQNVTTEELQQFCPPSGGRSGSKPEPKEPEETPKPQPEEPKEDKKQPENKE